MAPHLFAQKIAHGFTTWSFSKTMNKLEMDLSEKLSISDFKFNLSKIAY